MKSRVKVKSRSKSNAARAKSKASARSKARKARAPIRRAKVPGAMKVPDPLDAHILAATGALGLKVEKSWLRAVRGNLRVTLDQAAIVSEFPLPDDAEPAPVFRA